MGCHALLLGIFPNPGIEPMSLKSLALAGRFFSSSGTWKPRPPYTLLKCCHCHRRKPNFGKVSGYMERESQLTATPSPLTVRHLRLDLPTTPKLLDDLGCMNHLGETEESHSRAQPKLQKKEQINCCCKRLCFGVACYKWIQANVCVCVRVCVLSCYSRI